MTGTTPSQAGRVRVAVIGGGRNCEHEVSLATAASVRSALDPAVYDVLALTIGRDGLWQDGEGRPLAGTAARSLSAALTLLAGCDVAFPAVHGPYGEDGTLAALLDLADVPYVGSGVRGGALAMDKWATKLVAEAVGVAVAPGLLVTADDAEQVAFDGPVVVKPVAAGSSHGVSSSWRPRSSPRHSPRRSASTTASWSSIWSSGARWISPCCGGRTAV